jgi:hypothetical protein
MATPNPEGEAPVAAPEVATAGTTQEPPPQQQKSEQREEQQKPEQVEEKQGQQNHQQPAPSTTQGAAIPRRPQVAPRDRFNQQSLGASLNSSVKQVRCPHPEFISLRACQSAYSLVAV